MMLQLPRSIYDRLIDLAIADGDHEVCGLLAGSTEPYTATVFTIYPATNSSDVPTTRYLIDPEEQLRLMDQIAESGEELIGFYHSHPTGPDRPSQTDVDRAAWPNKVYVIISLAGHPYVGAWRWQDDRFEPAALTLTNAI